MTAMHPAAVGLPMVYLVDDEPRVRKALAWLLRSRRQLSETFASAEEFWDMLSAQPTPWPNCPSCLILDVRMPGDSGTMLFRRLADRALLDVLPVMFLTGHGDVLSAVDAMKRGAFDFLEKPFADNALVDRVEAALKASGDAISLRDRRMEVHARQGRLTDRELSVMQRLVEGFTNQQIADELGFSLRTVEIDRARLFEKMAVRTSVELANLLNSKVE